MFPENPEETRVIVGSTNMRYLICIWHCQDSNSQSLPSQVHADSSRPQWRLKATVTVSSSSSGMEILLRALSVMCLDGICFHAPGTCQTLSFSVVVAGDSYQRWIANTIFRRQLIQINARNAQGKLHTRNQKTKEPIKNQCTRNFAPILPCLDN